jgi:hypothetical protein
LADGPLAAGAEVAQLDAEPMSGIDGVVAFGETRRRRRFVCGIQRSSRATAVAHRVQQRYFETSRVPATLRLAPCGTSIVGGAWPEGWTV